MVAAAPAGAVVVQDIPLLVETGQGSNFHLVVVVDAPDDVRVQRMVEHRDMSAEEARARMAAQATPRGPAGRRRRRAGQLGHPEALRDAGGRACGISGWCRSPRTSRSAGSHRGREGRSSPLPIRAWAGPGWPADRPAPAAVPQDVLAVDHIGSTAVPGLAAKDVIDLQLSVRDLDAADRIAPLLAAAGFPRWPGIISDNPKPSHPDPADWGKAAPRQRRSRPGGEPARPRRRLAGLAVRPVLPRLASRRRRGPGGLCRREEAGCRAAQTSTNPPPATRRTRRRWFTDVRLAPDGSVGCSAPAGSRRRTLPEARRIPPAAVRP